MEAARLDIAPCASEDVAQLAAELAVSSVTAQVLARRGLLDPRAAAAFLAADEEHSCEQFTGIAQIVESILGHVREGSRITVHGDYDVDGVCSTAVLVRALRALRAQVDWYLPDRASDGYGVNARTVTRLAQRGTRLLIAVDCGITAAAELAAAREAGMDVIVADHHTPPADGLPQALILHPRLCGYPCEELCATAVAYKLALALAHASGRSEEAVPRTWISWRSRRSPTASRCAARTVRSRAAACARSRARRSPGCARSWPAHALTRAVWTSAR